MSKLLKGLKVVADVRLTRLSRVVESALRGITLNDLQAQLRFIEGLALPCGDWDPDRQI